MPKSKNVLINQEIFLKMWWYFEEGKTEYYYEIKDYLNDKIERLYNHNLYTQYKRGSEEARQKYLDQKLIPKDFRW